MKNNCCVFGKLSKHRRMAFSLLCFRDIDVLYYTNTGTQSDDVMRFATKMVTHS